MRRKRVGINIKRQTDEEYQLTTERKNLQCLLSKKYIEEHN